MKRIVVIAVLALMCAGLGTAGAVWEYEPLPAFDPVPDNWNGSMDFADNVLAVNGIVVYSSGGDVYGLDRETGVSSLMCDPTLLSEWAAGPSGFVVSKDGKTLYFHDNGFPTIHLFSYTIGDPADTYSVVEMDCQGSIYALTINPWTDRLWFVTGGDDLYLYEVMGSGDQMEAELRATVFKQHAPSGNGPVIFKGPSTALFGEAPWGGAAYFHLVDSTTGEVIIYDYLAIAGGLSAATYGYNNEVYAVTGFGSTVEQIRNDQSTTVVNTNEAAMGLAYAGDVFFLGEANPTTGAVSGHVISDTEAVQLATPEAGYRYAALPNPEYGIQPWNLSLAYYGDSLIYSGTDNNVSDIYAYNPSTGESSRILDVDFSQGSSGAYGPSGFTVGDDGYLYFHDNGNPTNYIYRSNFDSKADNYETLDLTGLIQGSIWDMTWNPWTNTLWVCSASFGGPDFYLYEIASDFSGLNRDGISFAKPHGDQFSGNGPIIFKNKNTLLYGESVWMTSGYLHTVDVASGAVMTDTVVFSGGLNAAVYGYDQNIYVSTGDGQSIYMVDPATDAKTLVSQTSYSIGDLVFDGRSFYLSGDHLLNLWQPLLSGVPEDQAPAPEDALPDADLSVVTNAAKGRVAGIQTGQGAILESLKHVPPGSLSPTGNVPTELPFGMLDFRIKVDSIGGTAKIKVHFSEAVGASYEWWKHDALNGWSVYPHAKLVDDGFAMVVTLVDGGIGDADGMANGYIVDPGGPGDSLDKPVDASKEDGVCFVRTTAQDRSGSISFTMILLMGLAVTALNIARMRFSRQD